MQYVSYSVDYYFSSKFLFILNFSAITLSHPCLKNMLDDKRYCYIRTNHTVHLSNLTTQNTKLREEMKHESHTITFWVVSCQRKENRTLLLVSKLDCISLFFISLKNMFVGHFSVRQLTSEPLSEMLHVDPKLSSMHNIMYIIKNNSSSFYKRNAYWMPDFFKMPHCK